MLSAERRKKILQKIEQAGVVEINRLAEEFGVSTMTIRRDLDYLEAEQKIIRTYGGAMLRQDNLREYPFGWKDERHVAEKEAIARMAVTLIGEGQSVILDAGSTTLRLARELIRFQDLLLVTNDIKIASEMVDVPGIRVLLTGGELKPQIYSLEGHFSVSMLSRLQVDTAFIGCDAFDAERGAMSNSLSKVAIKQAMLNCARRRILLADASKCGQRALATFADWDQFHAIVTDDHLPMEFQEQCQQWGIEVLIANDGGKVHEETRGDRR